MFGWNILMNECNILREFKMIWTKLIVWIKEDLLKWWQSTEYLSKLNLRILKWHIKPKNFKFLSYSIECECQFGYYYSFKFYKLVLIVFKLLKLIVKILKKIQINPYKIYKLNPLNF